MPLHTVNGTIKITVQGETVAQQFGNPLTATYNLNALASGVAKQSILSRSSPVAEAPYPAEIMDFLAQKSFDHYRDLIETPGFISFYSKATCIDVLERSKIGSRPARRTGTRSLKDLRAIPWVFSWNLSRISLTGWYGLGAALKALKTGQPEAFEALKKSTREVFIQKILTDYENGLHFIEELFEEPALQRREGQYDNLRWRNEKLLILHQLHIKYLKQWRSITDENSTEKEKILVKLLSLINSLSSGLKNTG